MAKFQLLSCYINLAGSPQNVVYRGAENPVTYPEALVLQAIHGGVDAVHTMVEVGETPDRLHEEELERLSLKYGRAVKSHFPALAGRASLPVRDDSIPTLEEVKAVTEAAAEAKALVRSKAAKKKEPAKEPAKTALPAIDQLPH